MKKILLIDNYDSFTYNLYQYLWKITGEQPDVFRNDRIGIREASSYQRIVLSPGPGLPDDAGILVPLIRELSPCHNILGVCLGHQAIARAFGGTLVNLSTVFHGISSVLVHNGNDPSFYKDIPAEFSAGRYHSWVVSPENLPSEMVVSAYDQAGNIMSMKHRNYPVRGVQFHPESVLTEFGYRMIENWIKSKE